MKKIFLLSVLLMYLSCDSVQDEINENNNNNINNTEENLSQYLCEDCVDFVKFNGDDNSFLNFLISQGFDVNNDSKISCSEALLITELDFGNNGYVKNTDGIEQFKNLHKIKGYLKFNCSSSNCSTILNLYNNINLVEIIFNEHYQLQNPSGISYGRIDNLVLPNSNSLIKLYSPETNFKNVINISNQENLKIINLYDSDLTGEFNLSGCKVLQSIDLSLNEINKIRFSEISNAYLDTLKIGLGNCFTCNPYNFTGRNISDINLITFPNLKFLDLKRNKIVNLDLSQNTNLSYLEISYNEILQLNLSSNTQLKHIKVDNNKISNLNVSSLSDLRSLSIKNNFLTNLNLSLNSNLFSVYVNNNDLETLNLKNGNNSQITRMESNQNTINCLKIDDAFVPNPTKWFKDNSTPYCY